MNDLSRIEGVAIQAKPDASIAAVRRSTSLMFSGQEGLVLSAVFGAWREVTKMAQAENAVLQSFKEFTVNNCQCYSSDTRDKLLSIIEAGCGTLDEFDTVVRGIELRRI